MSICEKLIFVDHDNVKRDVRGCNMTVDNLGRYWIWSHQLKQNLVYRTKGRENALLAAIDSLLYIIQLRDARINGLQRIADLAERFAEEILPEREED